MKALILITFVCLALIFLIVRYIIIDSRNHYKKKAVERDKRIVKNVFILKENIFFCYECSTGKPELVAREYPEIYGAECCFAEIYSVEIIKKYNLQEIEFLKENKAVISTLIEIVSAVIASGTVSQTKVADFISYKLSLENIFNDLSKERLAS